MAVDIPDMGEELQNTGEECVHRACDNAERTPAAHTSSNVNTEEKELHALAMMHSRHTGCSEAESVHEVVDEVHAEVEHTLEGRTDGG